MENSLELEKPSMLEGTNLRARVLRVLSRFLSHLAFENPVARVVAEMSLCFVIFEILVELSPTNLEQEHSAQWLVLWFGCCVFVAILDAFIFVPSFKIFNQAFLYATAAKSDLALNTFDQLNPGSKRFIHLPKKLYHLERTKLLADLNQLDLAQNEITKIPPQLSREISELSAEIVSLKNGFDALAGLSLNDFTRAVSLFERGLSESKFGVERSFLRQAKEAFLKIKTGGIEVELAKLYCSAADLFLGHAEEALPKLMSTLRPSAKDISTQYHLGKLYLSRALYGATHKEKELAQSDYRLGILLTRPYQVKHLKEKVRLELGEV